VNVRSGHSQSDGAVIDSGFVCMRAHESHERRLRPTLLLLNNELVDISFHAWSSIIIIIIIVTNINIII